MVDLTPCSKVWSTSLLVLNLVMFLCYHQQPQSGSLHAWFSIRQCCLVTTSSHKMVHLAPCSQSGSSVLLPPASTKGSTSHRALRLSILALLPPAQPQNGPPHSSLSIWQCCFATASNDKSYVLYIKHAFPDPRPDPLRAKSVILSENKRGVRKIRPVG